MKAKKCFYGEPNKDGNRTYYNEGDTVKETDKLVLARYVRLELIDKPKAKKATPKEKKKAPVKAKKEGTPAGSK